MKTCFFIGHRDAPEHLYPALLREVLHQIEDGGVGEFIVGWHGAFDAMAARAVIEAKRVNPGVRLTLLLAYHPSEQRAEIPAGFDGSSYPPGMESVPRRFAIVRANQYMARNADVLIAYAVRAASNARNLVEYAEKQGKAEIVRVE